MRYEKVYAGVVLVIGLTLSNDAAAGLVGVDVSTWQGSVNWNSMKNDGVSFGFARASYGRIYGDDQFDANMNAARLAGVPIGPYHFAYPSSETNALADPVKQDAINEATNFVNRIQPYYENYPGSYLRPVLDVEDLPSNAEINTVAEQRAYLSTWVKDFNSVVRERLGVDVIIYCNSNYAQNYLTSDISSFDLWIARWTFNTTSKPSGTQLGIWKSWDFWQWSDNESIGGESPVDADYFDGTLNDLQAYLVGGEPPLEGDYNDDGVVDAADYTLWRDTWTRTNTDLRADGNKNGTVDAGDRTVWASNYGAPETTGAHRAIPEPTSLAAVLAALAILKVTGRR